MSIKRERPELLGFINNAMNGIFHDPKNIFFTGRLFDLLFEGNNLLSIIYSKIDSITIRYYVGIYLDCSSEDFEVSGVCSELGSDDHAEVTILNETIYKFALFEHVRE